MKLKTRTFLVFACLNQNNAEDCLFSIHDLCEHLTIIIVIKLLNYFQSFQPFNLTPSTFLMNT